MGGDVPIGPPGGPPIPLNCDSVACTSAKADVVGAANMIKLKCGEIDAAKGRRDVFASIAAVLMGFAISLFVAAGVAFLTANPLGAGVALLLFIAGLALLALAILFWTIAGIFEIQVLVKEGELGTARNAFTVATRNVMTACPNSCWGDLTMPSC